MTGIYGGLVSGRQLSRMAEPLDHEQRFQSEWFETGQYGLALNHHGEKDPNGFTFWADNRTAGAIDGAITNLDDLGWTRAVLFERLLRAPDHTLKLLDGPFTIACLDASEDRILLATDKIGSRVPYYTTENGLAFASRLASLLHVIDDPVVDEQAVSDLLLMGHMWSDTTMLEGVNALHPASVLEFAHGDLSVRRYWRPDYTPTRPTDAYLHELTNAYQRTVARTATTLDGDVGLWLSGGLDSRATVNELARACRSANEFESLVTFTYDANPGGGVNVRLAADTARTLELPNETVPLTPDRFLPVMERIVNLTDGMVKWNTLRNLSAVYNIEHHDPGILLEGVSGELVGQHLSRYHITGTSSLVESMYRSEAAMTTDDVEQFLDIPTDPYGSFRKELDRIDEPTFEQSVIDAHFQNYYSRFAHASNPVPRSHVGTRIAYADGEFLSTAAKLPLAWRMGSVPFSNGKLIYGVVQPKIRMMRALNAELASIPYERSRLKPTSPYPLHVIGFFSNIALARLRSQPTYSGRSLIGEWYRTHDGFRERLDSLLDDASERPFFDADSIADYRRHELGKVAGDMHPVGAITTLEIWLQNNLD